MNQQSIAIAVAGVMPIVRATGLLVSLFTAQSPSGSLGTTGIPDGTYSNVTGLVDIPCTSPPESVSNISAMEAKQVAEVAAEEFHHVLLDNYYSTLDEGWRGGWRCLIDGASFDILGVENDSQFQMTRVLVRLVTT